MSFHVLPDPVTETAEDFQKPAARIKSSQRGTNPHLTWYLFDFIFGSPA